MVSLLQLQAPCSVHHYELHENSHIKGNQFWLLGIRTLQNLRIQCEHIILLELLSLHSSCTKAWNVRQNT